MTYAEFWPRYLTAHPDPRTRALHYLGSLFGIAALIVVAVTRKWPCLVAAPVVGYACAWLGHRSSSTISPKPSAIPLWSLFSDFRMVCLFVAGRLGGELRRAARGENNQRRWFG